MRNYEKLIAMSIIQLICQPRLFATERHKLMYQSDILEGHQGETFKESWFLDVLKLVQILNIQPSSVTDEIKMQNSTKTCNFSSLNRFLFFIPEGTMMFIYSHQM